MGQMTVRSKKGRERRNSKEITMALTITGQETFEKCNRGLKNAQDWLLANFPQYAQAFSQLMTRLEEENSSAYYGVMGIIIRMEYEGEETFKQQLQREYILTEAVREKVRAIIDSSESADARIDAWRDLKELVGIK